MFMNIGSRPGAKRVTVANLDIRKPLSANTTFYVATTGSDLTGDGTKGKPFASPQAAWNWIKENVDLNGWVAFIQMAAGTYDGVYLNQGGTDGLIQFQGVNNSPTSVILSGSGLGWGVLNLDAVAPIVYFSDLTIQNGIGLFGRIYVRFGNLGGSTVGSAKLVLAGVGGDLQIRLNGPVLLEDFGSETVLDCTATANIRGIADLDGGARLVTQSFTSITGTPAMTDAFFKITGLSVVEYNAANGGAGPTGTATGKRFILETQSALRTYGAAETTIPGDLPGTIGGNSNFVVTTSNSRSQITSLSLGAPVTKTNDYVVAVNETWTINNKAGSTCIVTLPAAVDYRGRIFNFLNYQAQTVVSASSDVVPITGGAATTAILPGVAGKWATLVSDGTNWVITQSN